jgi:hypothetical protein
LPQAEFAVLILGTCSSRKEASLTTLSSYSLQHEISRVFRGRVLCHRKSKRRQVEIGEQCFSLTKYDGCKRELQGFYEPSSQTLPHSGNTSSDLDILVARCLFRKSQRLFDSAGDKVESRPSLHHQRLTLVVRQNEGWRIVRRIVAPPALPCVVQPGAADAF